MIANVDGFSYAGVVEFVLKNVVRVERHHFVDEAPTPRRLIIVQLEAFLPGVDDHYRYALRDPQLLDGERYGRTSSRLVVSDECASEPQGEMARSVEFLEGRGFVIGDAHAVARYARIIGEDRRREILIFYHEVGGSLDAIYERFERAVTRTAYS